MLRGHARASYAVDNSSSSSTRGWGGSTPALTKSMQWWNLAILCNPPTAHTTTTFSSGLRPETHGTHLSKTSSYPLSMHEAKYLSSAKVSIRSKWNQYEWHRHRQSTKGWWKTTLLPPARQARVERACSIEWANFDYVIASMSNTEGEAGAATDTFCWRSWCTENFKIC